MIFTQLSLQKCTPIALRAFIASTVLCTTALPFQLHSQEINVPELPTEEISTSENTKKSLKKTTTSTLADDAYVMRHSGVNQQNRYKVLTLGDVLEQGLRQNYDQLVRNHEKKLLDSRWKDTYGTFWFPQVNLSLSTDTYRLGEVFDGGKDAGRTSERPSGNASLSFGNYTVFNWGKDYLQYLSDRFSYKRNLQVLGESRRSLKQQLITQFFELLAQKKIEKAYREQLRSAAFIYRFNRERFTIGKTNKLQFLQARSEYLKAQSEYQEIKIQSEQLNEKMSYLISDEVGTQYILKEDIKFEKIKLKESQAYQLSQSNNPNILSAKTAVENQKRSFEIQKRENLPLPKLTVNLGAYDSNFNRYGQRTLYETEDGNSNIELVATLTATWSVFGEGGLFNSRKTQQSMLQKNQEIQKLIQNKHLAKSSIRQLFRAVKRYEKQIEILRPRVSNAEKLFESAMKEYTEARARFPDFKDALSNLTLANVALATAEYEHIKSKIQIAKEIGIEELPGEVFEKLAILEKDKE